MELLESNLGTVVFARLQEDDDLLEAITQVAKNINVSAGFFFVIGTLKRANLGFYREGGYQTIPIAEPLEIVSCTGNISMKENTPFPHAHIAVSNAEGKVFGGHAMQGCIIAVTGELVLMETKTNGLLRKLDKKRNLFLWSLDQ